MIPYILIALISLFIAFCCGCAAGYSTGYKAALNYELYLLSQRLVSNDKNAKFAAAFNMSYTDIYDYGSEKDGDKIDVSSERGDKETP